MIKIANHFSCFRVSVEEESKKNGMLSRLLSDCSSEMPYQRWLP